jgi:hypothetical protein
VPRLPEEILEEATATGRVDGVAIENPGRAIWPLIPYSYNTINYGVRTAPSPPDRNHWLGTDDQTRDVVARVIYGFRISVLFALVVAGISSVIGIASGRCRATSAAGSTCSSSASSRSGPTCRASTSSSSSRDLHDELLAADAADRVLQLDEPRRRGAGGVPAGAQLRVRAGGPRARGERRDDHVAPPACRTRWWRR